MSQCYLCKSKKLTIVKSKLRHGITRKVFKCQNCDLVFLAPKKRDLQKYYKKVYREVHSPVIGKGLTSQQIFDHYSPLQKLRVERVKKYLGKNKRVLDIGCSAGHFLNAIKKDVKETIGIEFNEANSKFVNQKLGIKCYTEPLEKTDLPKGYFDIIFCLHTLEHVEDPLHFLKTVREYLKDDGMIYMKLPNIDDAVLSVYRNDAYEEFYYKEPHLFYYSPKTLEAMMNKAGFKGEVLPFQWYNFLNHMHWIHANGPQKSDSVGMGEAILVESAKAPKAVRDDLNRWIKKVNKDYRDHIERHMVSDYIVFVGKKK